ncbi:MAG: hypothetical protein IJH63_11815 [Methanobrevibacter sp.]|nr:hypothetical protein [Methanobrevibacter sp.]
MKKIIFCLLFLVIALAGVSCASASDLNESAVEIDQDINAIDDIDEAVNDTQRDTINDTNKVVENTANEIQDPIEYYTAQYLKLKENYSKIWYMPPDQAFNDLMIMIYHDYGGNPMLTVEILTEVFCLVEFKNPSSLVICAVHEGIDSYVWHWYFMHAGDNHDDHGSHSGNGDRRQPLG